MIFVLLTMKIAVLVSGGVDSSVALRLLKDAGHEVHAFYLKIWLEDDVAFLGECPWEEDLGYVIGVCDSLGVPFVVVPLQKEYYARIVSYTLESVRKGLTPNPDVLCNQQIKFGAFFDAIDSSFEKIASGHYAQVELVNGVYRLKRAPDLVKDQTYFLSLLSQEQLSRALFPIGHMVKHEVRHLAADFNLPNKDRKDSQGICFLGKISFDKFIEHHVGVWLGDIVDVGSGDVIGRHRGFYFYTIGQRKGLDLSGGPWYVVGKDSSKNIVHVAHAYSDFASGRDSFDVSLIQWNGIRPVSGFLGVRIRHVGKIYDAEVALSDDGVSAHVVLPEADHGVTPGQFAVFYGGSNYQYCLGGGTIV